MSMGSKAFSWATFLEQVDGITNKGGRVDPFVLRKENAKSNCRLRHMKANKKKRGG